MKSVALLLFAGTGLLLGQGTRIEAEWSADTVLIGQPVVLQITAQTGENAVPHFPGLTLTNPDITLDSTHFEPNAVSYSFTFWSVGRMSLPGIPVQIEQGDGSTITIATDSMSLFVVSSLTGEDQKIREIKEMVPLHLVNTAVRQKKIAGLILLVLAIIAIWVRRQRGRSDAGGWKRRHPGEIAITAIESLREQVYHPYDAPEKYQELSAIVRNFIEVRYLFKAMEMTTSEIKEMLPENVPDLTIALHIGQLLEQCDLAKFARQKHPQNKWRNDLDLAQRIVEKTRVALMDDSPAVGSV